MITTLAAILILALQHSSMPAGMSHEEHQQQMQKEAELKRRGEAAMGFDQDKTVHHFCTSASGGSIEVEVKDAADTVSLAQVRAHLEEIAAAFTHGDFARPMQTHAEVPPGVPVMERLKSEIVYRYAPMAKGGAVTIQTRNKEALAAIHEFLQYQTREHHTR